MMNYLRPSSRPLAPVARFVMAVAALSIAAVVGAVLFFPASIAAALHLIGRPLWGSAQGGAAPPVFLGHLRTKQSLINENQTLTEERAALALRLLAFEMLVKENAELKALAGRAKEGAILAAVLVRPNVSPYDTLVIDAGAKEGVSAGALVFAEDHISIGTIDRVYEKTAVVRLFSMPGEKTLVQIGSKKIQAEALGKGSGNFEVRLPRDAEVAEGDLVIMPGINQKLFGVVDVIIAEASDPFQTILFKSPVNPQYLGYVQVGK